jgi:ABC-type transport system involved in cytochrome bd biosynthesis fused ATPase/permease subunit
MIRMFDYRRLQFRQMNWRTRIGIFVGAALAIALAAALVVLSLGLALILLPVVAIALLIGRWRFNKLMAEARRQASQSRPAARTIEVEYSHIDDSGRR